MTTPETVTSDRQDFDMDAVRDRIHRRLDASSRVLAMADCTCRQSYQILYRHGAKEHPDA